MIAFAIISFVIILYFAIKWISRDKWITPNIPFPPEWRTILIEKISFYNSLSEEEKQQFEYKVHEFLLNYRITGINVNIDQTDKILLAASAVIPVLAFPDWRYTNLSEVLIYPDMFNEKFETEGPDREILGMVGSGYMEGKMIISKPALHFGFANESDKKNTAIHEFVHLIDKQDGVIDGIPELLLEHQYSIPWFDLMYKEIDRIYANQSDINPYGATNTVEFFAVVSEYFFERPKLMQKKHPELYSLLEKTFHQKMSSRKLKSNFKSLGRNSKCPCGSGKKFKNCCGHKHKQLQ
ncbi:MAG: zinc-dependent peptidase [Saprospiraceae bacterium]|nr:zinc-dependent peptidase [Saprospiraceae bacterium]